MNLNNETNKLRTFVLTDIENEPDDAMSMVRFLTYSNQWDVEGLVATTSVHLKDKTAAWRIREIVEAYGEVRDNLEKHEPGYPDSDYLLSIIDEGLPVYGMEGDSPTFMYLIDNGLGNPEHPDWGSWGGRYEFYTPPTQKYFLEAETRPLWTDAVDEVLAFDGNWYTTNKATIWRWRSAYQNDFAARMDWTIKSYEEANHPPVPKLGHPERLTAKQGERVNLSAKGSSDPDGDELSYEWIHYDEAGTFTAAGQARKGEKVEIQNADKEEAWFIVPTDRVLRTGTIHIILVVTDHGKPALTRYKRVIVGVE